MVESDLQANLPVTEAELQALERLLGPDLDIILSTLTSGVPSASD